MSKTIQEAFEDFHRENPGVYTMLVRMAREAKDKGHAVIGIDLLFCVIRWERMMGTSDPSQATFKLNDHYRSRYARLIMQSEPDLDGIFATRARTSHGPNGLYAEPPSPAPAPVTGAYDPFSEFA